MWLLAKILRCFCQWVPTLGEYMIEVESSFWSYPSKQIDIFKFCRQIALFEQFITKGVLCFIGKVEKTLIFKVPFEPSQFVFLHSTEVIYAFLTHHMLQTYLLIINVWIKRKKICRICLNSDMSSFNLVFYLSFNCEHCEMISLC